MENTKEKILLLLLGGLAFGCSYTPGKQWMVLKTVSREWSKLDKKELRMGINDLYKIDMVDKEKGSNGFIAVKLTEKGKLRALNVQLKSLKNKKVKWDGKWRMVSFDVPEKLKKGRDNLRYKLKGIGFCELQKSVLVFPYDCEKEMSLLIKLFDLKKYVRFGVLESIDNELDLKKTFKLL